MPRILVVASERVSAEQLRAALPETAEGEHAQTEVLVVVPALQESALRFWMADVDDAIARADEIRRDILDDLGRADVPAVAATGDSDPEVAISDALETFPAERILIFSNAQGHRLYREDVDPAELEARFGVPVTRAPVR